MMHKWEEDEREVTLEVECYRMPNSAHGERSNKGCDGCDGQWHDTSTPLPTKARHAAYRNTVTAQRTGDACAQMTQDGVALLKATLLKGDSGDVEVSLAESLSQSQHPPRARINRPNSSTESNLLSRCRSRTRPTDLNSRLAITSFSTQIVKSSRLHAARSSPFGLRRTSETSENPLAISHSPTSLVVQSLMHLVSHSCKMKGAYTQKSVKRMP